MQETYGFRLMDPCIAEIPYGEEMGNQLQYSCLGNHGQRNLVSYSPWGYKSDTTAHACTHIKKKLNMIISYNPPNLLPGYTQKIFSYMCKCHYFNAQSKILKQNLQEENYVCPSFPFINLSTSSSHACVRVC